MQHVLAVSGITAAPAIKREVEEGLIEVEVVVEVTEAMRPVRLGVGLLVAIIIGSFFFIGQDLNNETRPPPHTHPL